MSKREITKEQKKDRGEAPLCACGCGEQVNWNNRKKGWYKYLRYHHTRTPEFRARLRQESLDRWRDPDHRQLVITKGSQARLKWWEEHPEQRKVVSQRVREWWKNEDNRAWKSERSHQQWEDPTYVEKMRNQAKQQWKDPNFAKLVTEASRKFMKKRWQDSDYRDRQCQIRQENGQNPAFKKKVSEASKLVWQRSGYKDTMSTIRKRLWQDSEYAERMRQAISIAHQKPESKAKQRQIALALWQNPDHVKKVLSQCSRTPNDLESFFAQVTPDGIRYIGDGSWWRRIIISLPNGEYIAKYKNPDFKVTGKDKVIEVFGDYWHRNDYPQDLIDAYAHAGIECLVIWEREIYQDAGAVLERVADFIGANSWQMSLPLK